MKSNRILVVLPVIVLVCLNMSSPDISVAGGDKPAINFKGTVQDTDGNTYEAENITISGVFKQIPMYKKPNKVTTKPTANITRMDLSEVSMIMVPDKKEESFDGRNYIELEITYKDQKRTKERFIIEAHKRIWCDQVNQAGPIEKDLAFTAIESVTIDGYKMAELAQDKQKKKDQAKEEKSVEVKAEQKTAESVSNENKADAKRKEDTSKALAAAA